jgi:RecA-family ATPase
LRKVGNGTGSQQDLENVGTLLSEVEPERVEWLWLGRIPKGKVSLIEGDPGTGKSALTTDLAARVSAGGELPDGAPCEVAGVVLISAEDGLRDTIRPRLDAAGADTSRVVGLATVPDLEGAERLLGIPADMSIIERGMERVGAGLVVVDPLAAFLGPGIDAHKDQDVRRALAYLLGRQRPHIRF